MQNYKLVFHCLAELWNLLSQKMSIMFNKFFKSKYNTWTLCYGQPNYGEQYRLDSLPTKSC